MYEDEYKTAVKVAKDNLDRIINQMPPNLATREEKLFGKLSKYKRIMLQKIREDLCFLG